MYLAAILISKEINDELRSFVSHPLVSLFVRVECVYEV